MFILSHFEIEPERASRRGISHITTSPRFSGQGLSAGCSLRRVPSDLPQTYLGRCLQMCEDLAADNVMYAEIRTTPKNRPECNIDKRSYVEAVLAGISQYRTASCVALKF